MYIYIGSDHLINEEDVVGMFDIETTTTSYITRDYLTAAQKNGRIINVSSDIPKTFVVLSQKRQYIRLSFAVFGGDDKQKTYICEHDMIGNAADPKKYYLFVYKPTHKKGIG